MDPARLASQPQIKAAKNRGILTAELASQARHDMDAPNGLFALRIVVANHAKENMAERGLAVLTAGNGERMEPRKGAKNFNHG